MKKPAATIQSIRTEFDALDAEIARLLGQRHKLATRIGVLKRERGMLALDSAREAAVIVRFIDTANFHGIPRQRAATVIRAILQACRSAVADEVSKQTE